MHIPGYPPCRIATLQGPTNPRVYLQALGFLGTASRLRSTFLLSPESIHSTAARRSIDVVTYTVQLRIASALELTASRLHRRSDTRKKRSAILKGGNQRDRGWYTIWMTTEGDGGAFIVRAYDDLALCRDGLPRRSLHRNRNIRCSHTNTNIISILLGSLCDMRHMRMRKLDRRQLYRGGHVYFQGRQPSRDVRPGELYCSLKSNGRAQIMSLNLIE
jgi:hypothetical protein